jgi:hypothetical protein
MCLKLKRFVTHAKNLTPQEIAASLVVCLALLAALVELIRWLSVVG